MPPPPLPSKRKRGPEGPTYHYDRPTDYSEVIDLKAQLGSMGREQFNQFLEDNSRIAYRWRGTTLSQAVRIPQVNYPLGWLGWEDMERRLEAARASQVPAACGGLPSDDRHAQREERHEKVKRDMGKKARGNTTLPTQHQGMALPTVSGPSQKRRRISASKDSSSDDTEWDDPCDKHYRPTKPMPSQQLRTLETRSVATMFKTTIGAYSPAPHENQAATIASTAPIPDHHVSSQPASEATNTSQAFNTATPVEVATMHPAGDGSGIMQSPPPPRACTALTAGAEPQPSPNATMTIPDHTEIERAVLTMDARIKTFEDNMQDKKTARQSSEETLRNRKERLRELEELVQREQGVVDRLDVELEQMTGELHDMKTQREEVGDLKEKTDALRSQLAIKSMRILALSQSTGQFSDSADDRVNTT